MKLYGRSRVKPILTQREIQYSDGGVSPSKKSKIQSSYISFVLVLVPLGTKGTNDGF